MSCQTCRWFATNAASQAGRPRRWDGRPLSGPAYSRRPTASRGLGAGREQRDPHDLALPDRPDRRKVREVDHNTARPTARVAGLDGDDLIARVDQVLNLTPYALPRLPVLPPPVPDPLVSPVDLSLDQTLQRTPSVV